MNAKLDHASRLYLEGIRDGNPQQAITRYTGKRYTQHSAGVADGQQGFIEFFKPFVERNPVREIEILRSIVDGQYVFVHVFQSLNHGEAKWVTMDMFDTDEADRIIEHWDVIAAYGSTPSGADMITAQGELVASEPTDANKRLVTDFLKLAFAEGHANAFDDYVARSVVQHSAWIEAGVEGWRQWQSSGVRYEFVLRVIGQGNLVASLSKIIIGGKAHAGFNLFRIEDQRIAEHWDCIEEIAPRENWANSGKF